jgi:hypothetical protein
MTATGCVSIPHEHLSGAIEIQELSDHVHFLAQPALKGRKPKTWESAIVRKYLKNRFEAYGLVPWSGTKAYEQPFGFGTNFIGVLPGADPNLSDEIVILSAHYDHVGKTKKGVLLGACDNASGVAALLEIAEYLNMSASRPRRSICFASFDCEEKFTLGSFVFTCREDVKKAKVVAVVNVDLLGRDFLDVVDNSLFVVGTELYPTLRSQILQEGKEVGIEVLPIGTDLVGPRGDHVAFETMKIPVLFFTCGVYKDYHKPTDIAEKLSYQKMQRSVSVIAEAVRTLANSDRIKKLSPEKCINKEEMQTFAYVLDKVKSNKKELDAKKRDALQELIMDAKRLSESEVYTMVERRRFLRKITQELLPTFAGVNCRCAESGEGLLCFSELYATHRTVLTECFRKAVRGMLKSKQRIFSKEKLKYETYDLSEEEISFVKTGDGEYILQILLPGFKIHSERNRWLFGSRKIDFSFSMQTENCMGSKGEITDFCLLEWSTNFEDESFSRAWQKVLKKVTGVDSTWFYNDWLKWRLAEGGWSNEEEWVLGLIESDNTDVARLAISRAEKIASKQAMSILCKIIPDSSVHIIVRVSAIGYLNKDVGSEGLLALVDVLDDKARQDMEYYLSADKSGPLADHPCVRWVIEISKKWYEKNWKPLTIGDHAENKLKQLTKRDFGGNANAWRKWIKANVK